MDSQAMEFEAELQDLIAMKVENPLMRRTIIMTMSFGETEKPKVRKHFPESFFFDDFIDLGLVKKLLLRIMCDVWFCFEWSPKFGKYFFQLARFSKFAFSRWKWASCSIRSFNPLGWKTTEPSKVKSTRIWSGRTNYSIVVPWNVDFRRLSRVRSSFLIFLESKLLLN